MTNQILYHTDQVTGNQYFVSGNTLQEQIVSMFEEHKAVEADLKQYEKQNKAFLAKYGNDGQVHSDEQREEFLGLVGMYHSIRTRENALEKISHKLTQQVSIEV